MSSDFLLYPASRHAAPAASAAAIRAAASRQLQEEAMTGAMEVKRPNYVVDVPVSAPEVDRWSKQLKATMPPPVSSSSALPMTVSVGQRSEFLSPHSLYAAVDGAAREDEEEAAVHKLAPMSAFVFHAVKSLPMTQLLKIRRQWLPHRQQFPLHQQRMAFFDAVLNHTIVALVGPCGSGRTLQAPMILSDTEVLKRRRLIVVSANETAAALTVARLREERGEDGTSSRTVAAVLPNLIEATAGSSIVVTTAEMLLRQLLCDPCLRNVGCVIIDDAHVRSEVTELCLSALRDLIQAQQMNSRGPTVNHGAAAVDGGGAAKRAMLRLVLTCPDEATATLLLQHMTLAKCKTTIFSLPAPANMVFASAASTLYLEDVVQWLLRCENEGSCLCRDVDVDLRAYSDNVDAVAKVMAVTDANFTNMEQFHAYWLSLIVQSVRHFDAADRMATRECSGDGVNDAPAATPATVPLSSIVVVAPNREYATVIAAALQRMATSGEATGGTKSDEEVAPSTSSSLQQQKLIVSVLAERTPFSLFASTARRTVTTHVTQRHVVVTTPDLAQTVLPSSLDVGLVVDCARNSYTAVEPTTMSDAVVVEYSSIAQLRHRRRLAKVSVTPSDALTVSPPHVIQLIPKSILHSAQHRHLNADVAQHIVFRLPLHRSIQLYTMLQAREEAALSSRSSLTTASGAAQTMANFSSVAAKVATLLSSNLIGAPAASANKYESVRRIMTIIENRLIAAGHLTFDRADGGRPVLLPLGVLALCLPVHPTVARLLAASLVLQPSITAVTAVAALWLTSDLLSSDGHSNAGRDTLETEVEAEEEQSMMHCEARQFFARDSLSDVVSALNVYKMWMSTWKRANGDDSAEEETAFLGECGVSWVVLQNVFATHVRLIRVLHYYKMVSTGPTSHHGTAEEQTLRTALAEESAPDVVEVTVKQCLEALPEEAAVDRRLHVCITAALYPSCVIPVDEDGVGDVYDELTGLSSASAAAQGRSGVSLMRRSCAVAEDCILSNDANHHTANGRPFVFLHKSLAAVREAMPTAVVEHVHPLHEAAAIVFAGETHERPKKVPHRCRGWSSVLTQCWRQTRRASRLPPAVQLPPVSIPVLSYDTVHCSQVICATDHNFSFTMRATSLQWLRELRARVAQFFEGVALRKDWPLSGAHEAAAALAEAWAWWERRHLNSRVWLREERTVLQHHPEGQQALSSEEAARRQRLYAYHVLQLTPGLPAMMSVPTTIAAPVNPLDAPAAAAAAVEEAEASSALPATYTGPIPPPDVDHIFRLCVKSVAAKGTREAEAQLLRDNPEMFRFLDPDDEYHGYYIYLLRQAAPDMEVLGDNLEELIAYLEGLEEELRAELGLPTVTEAPYVTSMNEEGYAADSTNAGAAAAVSATVQYEMVEVAPGEEGLEDEMGDGGGGLQLEADAVNLKKSAGPSLAEAIHQSKLAQSAAKAKAEDALPLATATAAAAMEPTPSLPVSFSTTAITATASNGGGPHFDASGLSGTGVSSAAGETLADKLKAMQLAALRQQGGGNDAASSSSAPVGVLPTVASTAPAAAEVATEAPPSAADLLAIINNIPSTTANAAPTTAASEESGFFFQAPTADELMALLGAPMSRASGAGNAMGGAEPFAGSMHPSSLSPPPPGNPLLRPPPPIPAKAIEERSPSVLVYPLPDPKYGNISLVLARALGDTMNMRIGPTTIVGNVARIDVPNRKVEARALALKEFTCVGKPVRIFKNDRIIDNAEAKSDNRRNRRRERRGDEAYAAAQFYDARPTMPAPPALTRAAITPPPSQGYDPSSVFGAPEDVYDGYRGNEAVPPPSTVTEVTSLALQRQIGVMSSSDDDGDNDGHSSDSSSSSSSLFSSSSSTHDNNGRQAASQR